MREKLDRFLSMGGQGGWWAWGSMSLASDGPLLPVWEVGNCC